jgi:hypothetical protein
VLLPGAAAKRSAAATDNTGRGVAGIVQARRLRHDRRDRDDR